MGTGILSETTCGKCHEFYQDAECSQRHITNQLCDQYFLLELQCKKANGKIHLTVQNAQSVM